MRKMMAGLIALGAVGCGDETGDALVRSSLDARDDGVRFRCECFWEDEYPSEAECLTANLYTNAELQCLATAFGPVAELNSRHVECVRDRYLDFLACMERFGCSVTEAQVEACEAEITDRCGGAAGNESLCFGLSGSALSNCQVEETRAVAASEACSPSE